MEEDGAWEHRGDAGGGRPNSFLLLWLACGHSCTSKANHCEKTFVKELAGPVKREQQKHLRQDVAATAEGMELIDFEEWALDDLAEADCVP